MITSPGIERYLMNLSQESDPHILEMERIAGERDFPIVDRLVGRLLFLLAKMMKPRLVVELGSGFGYSAYWFARAIDDGKVVLTDRDDENIAYARDMFGKAGLSDKARFHVGDAVEIGKSYKDIDILFIDVDKDEYLDAIKTLSPRVKRNGLVVADNTLWGARVIERARDRETEGIRRFNRYMFENPDFFSTIVPLRDGVLLGYKLV